MNDDLPEGISFGTMQAPLSWIYSHTVRFLGMVKVAVRDGQGFVLIRKGEAVAYFFRYGEITLRGNAAREYLSSIEDLEMTLCKYTEDEFAAAVAWCGAEEVPVHDNGPEDVPVSSSSQPHETHHVLVSFQPQEEGVRMMARCTEEEMTVLAGAPPEGLAGADIAAALWESESLLDALNAGEIAYFILETSAGRFCAVPSGGSIFCVLTEPGVPVGRVRSLVQGLLSEQ